MDRDFAPRPNHRMSMLEPSSDFFEPHGLLPPSLEDVRRFPRCYFRSVAEATIHCLGSGQTPEQSHVLTRDLSRGGLSLLHSRQLFPGQRLDVLLADGRPRRVEVVWCRCQEPGTYLVGCRFVKVTEE
jgi:hypothetical protein